MPKKIPLSNSSGASVGQGANAEFDNDNEEYIDDEDGDDLLIFGDATGSTGTEQSTDEGLQSEVGTSYVGHVKTLVKMYEKLGAKVGETKSSEGSASTKAKSGNEGESCSLVDEGEDQVTHSVEDRLDSLERRMSAVLGFIAEFVDHQVDCLGSTFSFQEKLFKDLKLLKDDLNDLDDEFSDISAVADNHVLDMEKVKKSVNGILQSIETIKSNFPSLCSVSKKPLQ